MREVSPNEGGGPAAPTRETLKWIIDTCEMARRLEKKIANARGFAVNNRDCLAAHPPSSGHRWPIPTSQPSTILVKITGNATGGGKYTGIVFTTPAAMAVETGDLSEADLGQASGQVALILNVREVGKTTHDLTAGDYLPLVFVGKKLGVNASGSVVVAVDVVQQEDCPT